MFLQSKYLTLVDGNMEQSEKWPIVLAHKRPGGQALGCPPEVLES